MSGLNSVPTKRPWIVKGPLKGKPADGGGFYVTAPTPLCNLSDDVPFARGFTREEAQRWTNSFYNYGMLACGFETREEAQRWIDDYDSPEAAAARKAAHARDLDAEAEYYRKGEENYDKSGLSQAEGIMTNLLYAIQSFEASFNKMPEERDAWERVKELLCARLADLQQEAEWILYGQCYVVHARHVLDNKRQFFGKDARLEHPEQSNPDLRCYKGLVGKFGAKKATEMLRACGSGLLFEDFAPPEGKRTN
jgi:hypothetical protein